MTANSRMHFTEWFGKSGNGNPKSLCVRESRSWPRVSGVGRIWTRATDGGRPCALLSRRLRPSLAMWTRTVPASSRRFAAAAVAAVPLALLLI